MESKTEDNDFETKFDVKNFKTIKNYSEIKDLYLKIEELYYTYYKPERNSLLQSNISNLLKLIDSNLQISKELSKEEISFLYYLKCSSLDKLPEYTKESEESVNKSVNKKIFIYNFLIVKIKPFYSRQL